MIELNYRIMKLTSWNVNGIRSVVRKNALIPFIESSQPDILCVQETKAQPGEAEVDLPEYREYWNSADKKGYSGTALFSKIEPVKIVYGLPEEIQNKYDMASDPFGDPNTEGRVLVAEYEAIFVVTAYTPNSKDDLGRIPLRHKHWDPAILEYCQELEKVKPVVYCGDFNVAHTELDLANPGPNRGRNGFTDEERSGFQAFIDSGYVDTFRLLKQGNGYYTWWSHFGKSREKNVGWRIDYFLVSNALKSSVSAADIHPDVMGSDHCPISLVLDI